MLHKVRGWLNALLCSVAAVAAAPSAASILVREELGLSFLPSGLEWELEQNGPPVIYDLSAAFGAGAMFELRYVNDQFVITALGNNTVATDGLAFGLDVYPGDVSPISPEFDCLLTTPCYNGLGFLPWFTFPMTAGQTIVSAVPPGAVDEPTALALLATALLWLAWSCRSRRNLLPAITRAARQ
jgi:hypothetical protein